MKLTEARLTSRGHAARGPAARTPAARGVLAVTIAATMLAACAAETGERTGETRSHLVSAAELSTLEPGRELWIDLRDERDVWVFDQTRGGLDFARMSLVSPQGGTLPMERWLAAVTATLDPDLPASPFFALGAADTEAVRAALTEPGEGCADGTCGACVSCFQCGDHVVCTSCGAARQRDERTSADRPSSRGGSSPVESEPNRGPLGSAPPPSPPPPAPPTPTPAPI